MATTWVMDNAREILVVTKNGKSMTFTFKEIFALTTRIVGNEQEVMTVEKDGFGMAFTHNEIFAMCNDASTGKDIAHSKD